jgi:hypothetical protein
MRREQISVPMPVALREFAEQEARRDDRSVASWIRHLVAEAARRAAEQQEQAQ